MNYTEQQKLLDKLRKWINSRLIERDCDYWFVTLNLKQGVPLPAVPLPAVSLPARSYPEYLTRESANNNVRQFLTKLNRAVFGNAHKRQKKRLIVVDAAEGGSGTNKREHRHMLLEKPERLSDTEFKALVCETWLRTRWGYEHGKIERARSVPRVVHYVTETGPDAVSYGTSTF